MTAITAEAPSRRPLSKKATIVKFIALTLKIVEWTLKIGIVCFLFWFFIVIPLKGELWHDGEIDTAILATLPQGAEKQTYVQRYLNGSNRTIWMRCPMDEATFRQFCRDNQLVAATEYLGTENADALLRMHFPEMPRRDASLRGRLRAFFGEKNDWWHPPWVAIPVDDPAAMRKTFCKYVSRVRFILVHYDNGVMHGIDYDLSWGEKQGQGT